jgi:hypothetical protein
MNKKCQIIDCNQKHYVKGMCKEHYWRTYSQRPEAKARRNRYRQRPEVKERIDLEKRITLLRERKATYEKDKREFPKMLEERLACFERLYELHFIEKKEGLPLCIIGGIAKGNEVDKK